MYKKILVPIDGSPTSERGLAEAILLAKDQDAQLRLIHVINELVLVAAPDALMYMNEMVKALRDGGQSILDHAHQRVRVAGIAVEMGLLEAVGGQAGSTIIKDAEHWHADLIVLGTHGRRGLSRLVMGSDAEQVVRLTKVPVLLVRHHSA